MCLLMQERAVVNRACDHNRQRRLHRPTQRRRARRLRHGGKAFGRGWSAPSGCLRTPGRRLAPLRIEGPLPCGEPTSIAERAGVPPLGRFRRPARGAAALALLAPRPPAYWRGKAGRCCGRFQVKVERQQMLDCCGGSGGAKAEGQLRLRRSDRRHPARVLHAESGGRRRARGGSAAAAHGIIAIQLEGGLSVPSPQWVASGRDPLPAPAAHVGRGRGRCARWARATIADAAAAVPIPPNP
mmetsp:Transcript_37899/g.121950  ORF Transcript_37899/g.121950 Transcript_37899/m.121950 type:complete len:241 (-) Transcript_37899:985-1707(-)